ncbi:hypothetical protein J3F84DRAFT_379743, partial [Trichoderma pleuroticola]
PFSFLLWRLMLAQVAKVKCSCPAPTVRIRPRHLYSVAVSSPWVHSSVSRHQCSSVCSSDQLSRTSQRNRHSPSKKSSRCSSS